MFENIDNELQSILEAARDAGGVETWTLEAPPPVLLDLDHQEEIELEVAPPPKKYARKAPRPEQLAPKFLMEETCEPPLDAIVAITKMDVRKKRKRGASWRLIDRRRSPTAGSSLRRH